jgi:nitrile hydratase accessory protein
MQSPALEIPDGSLLSRALPCEGQADLVFSAPWEATAFAIVVSLSKAGHFTWGEWVECFSREVAAATAIEAAGGEPPGYYEQWLAAAEKILAEKNLTSIDQLRAKKLGIAAAGPAHALQKPARSPLIIA